MDGPEHKCMELTTTLLRYLGAWPRWRDLSKPSEKLYLCFCCFILFDLCLHIGVMTYCFARDARTWTTETIPLEDFVVYATGVIVVIKFAMIVWNQRHLQEVIDYINLNLNKRRVKSEEDRKEILACIRHERILVSLYAGAAGALFVIYAASGLIKIIRHSSAVSYESNLPMPYRISITERSVFFVTFLHQLIVMIVNGEVGTLVDAMFSCLLYYICGHLSIIKAQILKRDDTIDNSTVEYHHEILRLIDRVEEIFKTFLFLLFSVTSFLICLGLLQVTQAEDSVTYEKMSVYLTIKLSQLFLYCWYGQEIMERSSDVSFACYSIKWYEHLGRVNFQNFRFMLMRSQKPVRMRAQGFFLVSLDTLKSVINAAYSFYTLFNSVGN